MTERTGKANDPLWTIGTTALAVLAAAVLLWQSLLLLGS
jgi:hypothetical protein